MSPCSRCLMASPLWMTTGTELASAAPANGSTGITHGQFPRAVAWIMANREETSNDEFRSIQDNFREGLAGRCFTPLANKARHIGSRRFADRGRRA